MAVETSTYSKPFLTVDEQIDRLVERGMQIGDSGVAAGVLREVGYYRLSGYWYPFRLPQSSPGEPRPSQLMPGTSFEDVVEVYRFDEQLRSEVLRALAPIETALRFQVGHGLGRKNPSLTTILSS